MSKKSPKNNNTNPTNNSLWQSLNDDQQEVVKGGITANTITSSWPFRGFPW